MADYRTVLNWEELDSDVSMQEFFTALTFDMLWEAMHLGDMPYPLTVPSHGATENERVRLRDRAFTELEARGIRDSAGRIAPRIETWMGLLSQPSLSVDALHIPAYEAEPIAVLAATDGQNAVMMVQDGDGIWIRPTHADGLASEVVELLPAATRGTESAISLPLDEALHIQPERMPTRTHSPEQEGTDNAAPGKRGKRRQQRSLADRQSDPRQAYADLAGQPRLCGGQLAANSRNYVGRKQRTPVLAWFDTATGRYMSLSAAGSDGSEWLTISPADGKSLRSRLNEMIGSITTGN